MMHRQNPDTLDADELAGLMAWWFEVGTEPDDVSVHLVFHLDTTKNPHQLTRLHLTNGVNHRYLTPAVHHGVRYLPPATEEATAPAVIPDEPVEEAVDGTE